MANLDFPLKAIRQHCLDCSETVKYVTWCPCDGAHASRCHLWPFRFGSRPATFKRRHGPELLTPELMPGASVNLDDLPAAIDQAAAYLRQRVATTA
jgi:hypothetical protein